VHAKIQIDNPVHGMAIATESLKLQLTAMQKKPIIELILAPKLGERRNHHSDGIARFRVNESLA